VTRDQGSVRGAILDTLPCRVDEVDCSGAYEIVQVQVGRQMFSHLEHHPFHQAHQLHCAFLLLALALGGQNFTLGLGVRRLRHYRAVGKSALRRPLRVSTWRSGLWGRSAPMFMTALALRLPWRRSAFRGRLTF